MHYRLWSKRSSKFTGYLHASGLTSNSATLSVTVWSALDQPAFKNSVFLSLSYSEWQYYAHQWQIISVTHGCTEKITTTDRFGRRAFSVTGPQLWNQLPVSIRTTSANTSDCFKRALKTFLFQWVSVLLQLTAPLSNSYGGGYNKSHNININVNIVVGGFYPRDAMLARVFATATCPSVRPNVRHTPVLCLAKRKQDREMYTVW